MTNADEKVDVKSYYESDTSSSSSLYDEEEIPYIVLLQNYTKTAFSRSQVKLFYLHQDFQNLSKTKKYTVNHFNIPQNHNNSYVLKNSHQSRKD